MHNALHRKDGSEQNLINQNRHAKCLNFKVPKEKFQKDEVSPSLEQQTKHSFKVSIVPQKKDEKTEQLLQNTIKQRADDLYQEVYGNKSINAEDAHSNHLNDGVIIPPTLSDGLSSIKVGTDCSGLDVARQCVRLYPARLGWHSCFITPSAV